MQYYSLLYSYISSILVVKVYFISSIQCDPNFNAVQKEHLTPNDEK